MSVYCESSNAVGGKTKAEMKQQLSLQPADSSLQMKVFF